MQPLSADQIDAITEVINIGMGTAAASLSDMVNEEVTLSVPTVSFINIEEAVSHLDKRNGNKLSGVTQNFEGELNGNAILIFPEAQSLEIVRLVLQDTIPLEALTEMEQEALQEIGNVILNAGLSSLANFVETDLISGLPAFVSGDSNKVISFSSNPDEEQNRIVMFIKIEFGFLEKQIHGNVVYLLDIDSIERFKRAVDKYLETLS